MPYFARLNSENVVISVERVVGVVDGDAEGEAFLRGLYGTEDRFRFCKYDGSVRKLYPSVGCTFDEAANVFVRPQPYPSWTLDANNDWQAPVERPAGDWRWDEPTLSWIEVTETGGPQ